MNAIYLYIKRITACLDTVDNCDTYWIPHYRCEDDNVKLKCKKSCGICQGNLTYWKVKPLLYNKNTFTILNIYELDNCLM